MILLSSIEGNGQRLDGGALFGNAPKNIWSKWLSPDDENRVRLACRALLVEIDGKKILCETGIGSFFSPKLAARFGVENYGRHILLENLESLGISEEEIDIVLLSHLHFDHAGGLLAPYQEGIEPKLLFPEATYLVSQPSWDRAKAPHSRDKASFIPHLIDKLEASGRLECISPGEYSKSLPGCFELVFTDGHTPGQMHALISGKKQKVIFCGDLIPGTAWLHFPITMGYDRFPEKVVDEKKNLLINQIDSNTLLFYTHDPDYCCSSWELKDGRVHPLVGQKNILRWAL